MAKRGLNKNEVIKVKWTDDKHICGEVQKSEEMEVKETQN